MRGHEGRTGRRNEKSPDLGGSRLLESIGAFAACTARDHHDTPRGVNAEIGVSAIEDARAQDGPRTGQGIMFAEQITGGPAGHATGTADRASGGRVEGLCLRGDRRADAQQLADEIHARKAIPPTPAAPRKPVGSRPRSPAHMERRRRWTGSGWLPPQLACRFTMAETAVLSTIAAEVARRGLCRLTIGHIAAMAGVSRTTVQNGRPAGRGARDPDLRGVAAHGLAIGAEHRPHRLGRVAHLAEDARPQAGRGDHPRQAEGAEGAARHRGARSGGVGSDPRAPFGIQILL